MRSKHACVWGLAVVLAGCSSSPPPVEPVEPPSFYRCSDSVEGPYGRLEAYRTLDASGADYVSVNDWRAFNLRWVYEVNASERPGYRFWGSWSDPDDVGENGLVSIIIDWPDELPRQYSLHIGRSNVRIDQGAPQIAMQTGGVLERSANDPRLTHLSARMGDIWAFAKEADTFIAIVRDREGRAVQSMTLNASVFDQALRAARWLNRELDKSVTDYIAFCARQQDVETVILSADG